MPLKKTLDLETVSEFIGISLMLAMSPALVIGTANWMFYGLELGMHQTAFYYFRSTINNHLVLLIFLVFLLIFLIVNILGTRVSGDRAKGRRYTNYAIMMTLLGLLLVTGYHLNSAIWYPDSSSLKGICYNAIVVLFFVFLGLIIYKQSPRIISRLSLLVGSILIVTTNGYFYFSQSKAPVIFIDVAEVVGLREMNNSLGVAWGDYDDDGWLDLHVSNHLPASTKSLLYHNDKGRFSNPRHTATGDLHGAAWGDFDNDGALDLFIAGGNDTPKGPAYSNSLFHNQGGDFKDVASRAGVEETLGRAWGGSWADINNDGFLDLFVVNYFTSNDLFLNAGDGTFKNVAKIAGISETDPGEENGVGTLCASWADYDVDGDMDLVTVAMQTGISLYQNNGNGNFSEVAANSGLTTNNYLGTEKDPQGPSGCAWGDYDNDSDLDLYIGALSGFGKNLLFQNQGNRTFVEVGDEAGVDNAANSRAVMWGDFDNDGDLDLYVVNEASDAGSADGEEAHGWNNLYVNQGNGTFNDFDADAAGAAGFPFVREGTGALADYDNDGFIDIFINNQRPLEGRSYYLRRNLLLRNSGNRNNWLKIQLRGTVSNRDGVGAKILLSAGNQHQFREQGGGSHTFAQNSTVIHFGLGRLMAVDRILVKWPSGITQTLTNVPIGRTLTITESASP